MAWGTDKYSSLFTNKWCDELINSGVKLLENKWNHFFSDMRSKNTFNHKTDYSIFGKFLISVEGKLTGTFTIALNNLATSLLTALNAYHFLLIK